jgi:betaine-aldehyde dehydrogenase
VEAVATARRAFDEGPWPRTPAGDRGDLLLRAADLLVRDKHALARAESLRRFSYLPTVLDDCACGCRWCGRSRSLRC